jgi:hypothetical protein
MSTQVFQPAVPVPATPGIATGRQGRRRRSGQPIDQAKQLVSQVAGGGR